MANFDTGLRSWSPSIPSGVSASQDAHCIPFRSSWAIDGIIEITDFTGDYPGSNLNFNYILKTLRAIDNFKLEGNINVYSEPFLDLQVRYSSSNPGSSSSGPRDSGGTIWYDTQRVNNPDQTSPYSSHTWEFETPRRDIPSGYYIWIRFVGSVDGDDINTVRLRMSDYVPPLQLSGDMASGAPTMEGDLTVDLNTQLSGFMASGAPTMEGDLALDGPVQLSGDMASGAPTMSGDLDIKVIIPDQVLTIPAPNTVHSDYLDWSGLGLLIEPPLTIDQDTNIYLISLRLSKSVSENNYFFVSDIQDSTFVQSFLTSREMLPIWEQNLSAIRLQFGSLSAYIPGPDSSESTTQDDTEPYVWINNAVNNDLADIIDSVANGDAGNFIITLSSEYTPPPPPPLELSGSIASGSPTMKGDMTVPEPLELSGSIASGSPTMKGDLTVPEPLELSGSMTSGAPTMRGDLTVLPPIQLSGDMASGAPTMGGDLSIPEPLEPLELSGSIASGAPTMEGDLSLRSPLLLLSHWDSSGLIVDAAAVLVATAPPGLYANSDRGGTGVPLEGELGLSAAQTVISWIRWDGSKLILNDNNKPSALTISDYLILAANNLYIYLQTSLDGVVSFRIADNLFPASQQGGNYINIGPPQDASDLLDNISDGDRFLFAVASPAPIALSGSIASGAPTMEGDLRIVLPLQLSGDIASGAPTMEGDLAVLPPIQLSGDMDSGAPTMGGDLSVTDILQLSGDMATGSPTMEGDLSVVNPLQLSGDISSGAPAMEGDLTIKETLLLLADQDISDINVDASALLVATGDTTLYADSTRGGTGVPIDGELGLSATNTLVSKIFWDGTTMRLNDNDVPTELTLSSYLNSASNNLHIFWKTDTLEGSFRIVDHQSGLPSRSIRRRWRVC